jgi:heme/copper-type cytochrome/quinol oxidase subunit 2
MSSLILILLVLGIIMVLLLGVAVAWIARKKKRHEPDYRAFFWMGLIWMVFGGIFMLFWNFALNGLFAIGVIFFAMGAANRDKWKKRKLTEGEKRLGIIAFAIGVLVVAFGLWLALSIPY